MKTFFKIIGYSLLAFIAIAVIMALFGKSDEEQAAERAKIDSVFYQTAKPLLLAGNLDSVASFSSDFMLKYEDTDNPAFRFYYDYRDYQSEGFLKMSLAKLTDQQADSLKKGVLKHSFFVDSTLNSMFLDKLQANIGYRKIYIAQEKERQEAALKRMREEQRAEKLKEHFSPWDGSHRNLERAIKKSMNDEDSYEHIETKYWDMDDHLIILTTFSGKNSFNATVKNSVKAKVSLEGEVLEIIEQF